MNRFPIRVKLTVAFGLAMLMMLAGAALFVYLRLRADLDDRINASLRSRLAALIEPAGEPSLAGVTLGDSEEAFVQILSPTGKVLDSVGTLRGLALHLAEGQRATVETVTVARLLPGVDGKARLFARSDPDDAAKIVVAGQSLRDRDDALTNVVASFAYGGAIALVLASAIGYLLATLGFAPVEAIRRRAREVSLSPGDQGLPLPDARDEIRRLGETLNEMLARLRAAFERESRFVADASHELRTPIAIIKTELEGALQSGAPDTPGHASIVAAVEECDRLAQLADDLLVIASTTDGRLSLRPESTNVASLLNGVRDRFADRAGRRGRVIRVDVAPDLAVRADPARMRQALSNLVENALRYGEGEIGLVARGSANSFELDVSDEGHGFPQGFEARAFERFARGSASRAGDGVGLGLALVKAIAEAHGGSVEIASTAPPTVRIRILSADVEKKS